jgi:esterase/lipase superfamily enzyme
MTSFIRAFLRVAAPLCIMIGLTACAERPGPLSLHPAAVPAAIGTPVRVLVATTRQRSDESALDFTNRRAFALSYEQYAISVPPDHVVGKIELAEQPPGDPARDFVVTRAGPLGEAGFNAALSSDRNGGEVIVFVHGYNTNYQEAVFRLAQLSYDSGSTGTFVGFVWPSRGTLAGYLADRESSTYSRDYLEKLLNDLARVPSVKHINILAHSMGNWLVAETLRQAKLRGNSPFLPKLREVFMMSPDIDVDVFRTQLDVIGKLNDPITIGISRDDRALAASQRLAGDVPRVGNVLIDNPQAQAAIARYGLRVIDMSAGASPDALNHGKFVDMLPSLREIARTDNASGGNVVARTGLFVEDAGGAILQTPMRFGEAVLGR